MARWLQVALIVATLLGSWLGMQAVHELGHVGGAILTGATVERVVLHPLTLSRTEIGRNPQPLLVVWAGPLVGVLLPLMTWRLLVFVRYRRAYLVRFFAGFCLVANGLYLGVGSLDGIGDAGDLLRLGCPPWLLWGFGLITAPLGLALWHGEGRHFGLGPHAQQVTAADVLPAVSGALGFLLLGLLVGGL